MEPEPRPGAAAAAALTQPPEQERKLEQEKLSGVVKSVHRRLRRKYREVGDFDKIWREHCEDEETLCEYAVAMKNLADNHWTKSCEGEGRIEWCCSVCREYFQNGGKRKALEKDEKRAVVASKTTSALNVHQTPKIEEPLPNFSFTNHETISEEKPSPWSSRRAPRTGESGYASPTLTVPRIGDSNNFTEPAAL